jgi:peroxiredoxin
LIIPIVGLGLALREALVIIASSLSTHVCEAERRGKDQKGKRQKRGRVFRLVTTSMDEPSRKSSIGSSNEPWNSPTWDRRSNLGIHPRD